MPKKRFTLIELLVNTVSSSLHFFTRSAGSEKTRPSVFVSLRRDESLRWGSDMSSQRSPLFLKEKGARGKGKTFFPARSAGCEKTRPSVFVSLRRDESLRWGSDISSQRSPLFIRRYYRNLSDYTDSAHAVCLSYFDCCCKASNQTVRDAARLNSRRREGVAGDFPPPQVPAVVQV